MYIRCTYSVLGQCVRRVFHFSHARVKVFHPLSNALFRSRDISPESHPGSVVRHFRFAFYYQAFYLARYIKIRRVRRGTKLGWVLLTSNYTCSLHASYETVSRTIFFQGIYALFKRKVYKIVSATIYKIQFYVKRMLFPFQLELPI